MVISHRITKKDVQLYDSSILIPRATGPLVADETGRENICVASVGKWPQQAIISKSESLRAR